MSPKDFDPIGGFAPMGEFWQLNHYAGDEGFLGWMALQPLRRVTAFTELDKELPGHDRERVLEYPQTIVRSYCSDEAFLETAIQPFLAAAGHPETFRGKVPQLLRQLEPWRLYFLSRAYEIYNRAIQTGGYGHLKHPGSRDLLQATYLPFCDCFVTQDKGQKREIRRVSFFGHVPRRVITFNQFKSLAGCSGSWFKNLHWLVWLATLAVLFLVLYRLTAS